MFDAISPLLHIKVHSTALERPICPGHTHNSCLLRFDEESDAHHDVTKGWSVVELAAAPMLRQLIF